MNLRYDSDAGGGGGGDDDFPHLSCSLRYAKMSQRKDMGRRKGVTKAGHCHIFLQSAISNILGISNLLRISNQRSSWNQQSAIFLQSAISNPLGIRDSEPAIRDQVVKTAGCENWVMCGR